MDPGGVRWKLYLEAMRAWIPIVISICAISFTIYQGILSRRHTKLSVQPRVDWRIEEDALGFAGAKMTRRIIGLAKVVDLETIADEAVKVACERRALALARALGVERRALGTVAASCTAAREILGDIA